MFDVNKIEEMTIEEVTDLMNNPTKHGLTFGDVLRISGKLIDVTERMNKAATGVDPKTIEKKDQEIYRLRMENQALREHIDDIEDKIKKVIALVEGE